MGNRTTQGSSSLTAARSSDLNLVREAVRLGQMTWRTTEKRDLFIEAFDALNRIEHVLGLEDDDE